MDAIATSSGVSLGDEADPDSVVVVSYGEPMVDAVQPEVLQGVGPCIQRDGVSGRSSRAAVSGEQLSRPIARTVFGNARSRCSPSPTVKVYDSCLDKSMKLA